MPWLAASFLLILVEDHSGNKPVQSVRRIGNTTSDSSQPKSSVDEMSAALEHASSKQAEMTSFVAFDGHVYILLPDLYWVLKFVAADWS